MNLNWGIKISKILYFNQLYLKYGDLADCLKFIFEFKELTKIIKFLIFNNSLWKFYEVNFFLDEKISGKFAIKALINSSGMEAILCLLS